MTYRTGKLKYLRGCISFLDDAETTANVQNSQLETVEFLVICEANYLIHWEI